MTLLVCPVRPGDNNEELRYAIRSWETNLHLPSRLYLMTVGDCPSWLRPDQHVHGNIHTGVPANVFSNVEMGAWAAVDGGQEEVVYMNDDFFCLDPTGAILPVKRNISLADHIGMFPQYRGMWWVRSLDLTASWLAGQGFTQPWSYEVHRPLPCKPSDMLSALRRWDGGMDGDLPQWRTLYGVLNDIDAYPVEDVKLGMPDTTNRSAWASTSDSSWRKYGRDIARRFQKPSRWER